MTSGPASTGFSFTCATFANHANGFPEGLQRNTEHGFFKIRKEISLIKVPTQAGTGTDQEKTACMSLGISHSLHSHQPECLTCQQLRERTSAVLKPCGKTQGMLN